MGKRIIAPPLCARSTVSQIETYLLGNIGVEVQDPRPVAFDMSEPGPDDAYDDNFRPRAVLPDGPRRNSGGDRGRAT